MPFSNVNLLNPDYARIINDGIIEIVEKKPEGAGTCYFSTKDPTLIIKAKDQAPVVWCLENKKCAEGAFLVWRGNNMLELHIVEMKSSLTHKEFLKVLDQWRGMYLSALATLGILQAQHPSKVIVYIAYKKESIQTPDTRQPTFYKTLVGGGELPGKNEWNTEKIQLHHGVVANIVKKMRTDGDCDFGQI